MLMEEREQTPRRYQLLLEGNNIFLRVEQGSDFSNPSSIERLFKELARRQIRCKAELLEKCFGEATGEKVGIAVRKGTMKLGTLMDLSISADFLTATIQVYPSLDGSCLSTDALHDLLASKGIKYGIKENLIAEIIKQRNYFQEWLIAEGVKPQKGQDAVLHFLFDIKGEGLRPKELADGTVDFYELNLVQTVAEGTVLVEKTPPGPGVNGMDILGRVIKAPYGRDVRLPVGINTKIVENNTKLIATKQGHVNYIKGKIHVHPTFEVEKDVDFNTGNIKFPGNVLIRGNVKNTFTVQAGGDVEIFGNLEGTVVAEGNLKVNKGIVRGKAEVKGSIITRYIENSQVTSNEDIFVTEAIMHSRVKAGKRLVVSGKKGLIAGGHISVGQEIIAKNIGAPMGTVTILEVGVLPELREEYKNLRQKLKKLKSEDEENQKNYSILNKLKEKLGKLPPDKNELFIRICRRQYQTEKEIAEAKKRLYELEEFFYAINQAKVKVMNTVYCGVVITIGKLTLNINEEKTRVEFRIDDFEVRGFQI